MWYNCGSVMELKAHERAENVRKRTWDFHKKWIKNGLNGVIKAPTGWRMGFSPSVITGFPPAIIAGFSPAVITGFPHAVITGFPHAVITGFPPAIITGFSPAVITGFAHTVITGFPPAVIKWMVVPHFIVIGIAYIGLWQQLLASPDKETQHFSQGMDQVIVIVFF